MLSGRQNLQRIRSSYPPTGKQKSVFLTALFLLLLTSPAAAKTAAKKSDDTENDYKLPQIKLDDNVINGLIFSTMYGHVDSVKEYLKKPLESVDEPDQQGGTALMYAAAKGHLDIAEELLIAGAEINRKDDLERTALNYAAGAGRQDVVNFLLKHGADVNTKDSEGLTPLHHAVVAGQKSVVEALIVRGADANLKDKHGMTPLLHACYNLKSKTGEERQRELEIVDILVTAKGAELDMLYNAADAENNKAKVTLLDYAVNKKDRGLARRLIKAGAPINQVNSLGKTPMSAAIDNEDVAMIHLLYKQGGTIDELQIKKSGFTNTKNFSVLTYAAMEGKAKATQALLRLDENVNQNIRLQAKTTVVEGNLLNILAMDPEVNYDVLDCIFNAGIALQDMHWQRDGVVYGPRPTCVHLTDGGVHAPERLIRLLDYEISKGNTEQLLHNLRIVDYQGHTEDNSEVVGFMKDFIQLVDTVKQMIQGGDYNTVLKQLNTLPHEGFSNSITIKLLKAEIYERQDQHSLAKPIYKDLYKSHPFMHARLHFLIGQVYQRTGQYDLARHEFSVATTDVPHNKEYSNALMNLNKAEEGYIGVEDYSGNYYSTFNFSSI